MLIYNRIRELATLKGVKMPEIAKEAGVSLSTMKNWNKSAPSVSALLNVAKYFGVSVDYLLDYSDNPFSHKSAGLISRQLIQGLEQLSNTTLEMQGVIAELLSSQKDTNEDAKNITQDEK